MPARPSSNMSSSSGASFHTAHENRQSMYPGMQARVSDAGDSELARRPRSEFWAIVESTRHDQDSNSSRRQSRRHPSPLGAVSEAGECDSDDGSSRSSVSDYSLRPRDSASNRASSPSDDGYNPRNRSPRRNSRTHHRYEVEEEEEEEDHEYYDPRVGAIIIPIVCIDRRALVKLVPTLTCPCIRDQEHVATTEQSPGTMITPPLLPGHTLQGPDLREAMTVVRRALVLVMTLVVMMNTTRSMKSSSLHEHGALLAAA